MANNEHVSPITLTFEDGVEYTLEFDRDAVIAAEKDGFDITDMRQKPMTRIPQLFYFSFLMHHPTMKQEKALKILTDDLGGLSEGMIERLVTLYSATFESLVNEGAKPKNSKLKVKF